jgi:hAT family C-terminal dimerisation region
VLYPEPYGFDGEQCSAEVAESILREKYTDSKGKVTTDGKKDPKQTNRMSKERCSISFLDMLNDVEMEDSQAVGSENEGADEVTIYLKNFPREPNSDPLDFWRRQEHLFPVLSKLARTYLAIPASSGSVERLFSISGALQRSRRASLTNKMIEQMLSYRECRTKQLFHNFKYT